MRAVIRRAAVHAQPHRDARIAHLADALADEVHVDGRGVDLLQAGVGGARVQAADLLEAYGLFPGSPVPTITITDKSGAGTGATVGSTMSAVEALAWPSVSAASARKAGRMNLVISRTP